MRERVTLNRRKWLRTVAGMSSAAGALSGRPVVGQVLEQATSERVPGAGKSALLLDQVYRQHDTGLGHPEQPARYDAVTAALWNTGLADRMQLIAPRVATEDELALCHGRNYISLVEREVKAGRREISTGDATMSAASWDVARQAVGGVLEVVDRVMTGKAPNAFCAVRPPGHHARPAQGMGFCLFNNVAIGARYAQRIHGAERVLIADWDVHHGNGTQDIFYEDGSVFFFSTHQSPWYPGTGAREEIGAGEGRGTTMNRPFPAGSGRAEIIGAFGEDLRRAANEFQPDLVMISAGFDSRRGDPLGGFLLDDDDFVELTRTMQEIAGEHAGGRIVSVLEGGYDLAGLAAAVEAHVGALIGT